MLIMTVKLDKIDKKILAELDRNCRITSSKLAKKVLKSRQAVEYRIQQMIEKGIITGFHASFNPHKIGHRIYKIYLKLRNIPQEKNKLLNYLKTSGNVYWMGECTGRWDLIFGIFAKSDQEFYTIKNELVSNFTAIIVEEDGGTIVEVKQYSKMYFTNQICAPTMFGGEIVSNEIDKLDSNILKQIVNNARIPINILAKNCNSTATIVRNRLKKLEEKEIIIQYRISVNINKLGYELYKAIIRLDRYSKQDQQRMITYLSNIPNIQYFIQNLWQLEPELVVHTYQEYYAIIEELKKEFPNVIRTVDSVLMITDEWTPGFGNLLKSSD